MIDNSVKYIEVSMRRRKGTPLPVFALPPGYVFTLYKAGDEKDWARIETSVGEFTSEDLALAYFANEFAPYPDELKRRCIFVERTETGEKVATSTAWWYACGDVHDPLVHWVSVMPRHQDKGLGKAVVARTLSILHEIYGDADYYLHTQTTSHKAINIYEKSGFYISPQKHLHNRANDNYYEAVRILKDLRRSQLL